MTSTDAILLVIVVVLVVFAAVLAVAETAITRMTRARASALAESEPRRGPRVQRIVDNLERDLNAVYLAVNIVQTVQAALVGVLAGRLFGPLGVAIGIFLNVVVLFTLAEAAPKTWALQHTDRAALVTAPLVELVGRVLRWPARSLIGVANVLLPGKGLKKGPFVTEEEILALAEEAAEAAVIEASERDLIESIIDFGDTIVREIMVPRPDVVSIDADASVADAVELSIATGRSRFPVYGESSDDVLGMVYAKDAFEAERLSDVPRRVLEVARPVLFIPETKRVAELLTEMQARKTHIAVAVDEYGGNAGLVTLEDLLEELVGEIHDEFDEEAVEVEPLGDGEFLVNATLNVGDLNERLDLRLPEGTWDSVGGLVFGTLGRVPVPGDVVELDDATIVVEQVDGRRVGRVRLRRLDRSTPGAEA
ncbi:MAG: HlyC/CorC family transporter [Actinobacteria bacterium]|nr:HlyC/CorC family transporter [Actinomycetota bacterium]